jgi:hypothetical protein
LKAHIEDGGWTQMASKSGRDGAKEQPGERAKQRAGQKESIMASQVTQSGEIARDIGDPELARAEADVERSRARVTQSILLLRNEVARRTDWRRLVRQYPVGVLAAGLAVGFWWGYRK